MLLDPRDVVVFNDTRVIPARLFGRRGEARIEATLHRQVGPDCWRALARPAKRLKPGQTVQFSDTLAAEVVESLGEGEFVLRFNRSGADLAQAIEQAGQLPLPPYIRRPDGADARDRSDYQTLFARVPGAVAAPTAGLHFTPALRQAIEARGCGMVGLTLHVGAGTFLPVKTDDVREHRMHPEHGILSPEAAETINARRAAGGRVLAIGTTVLRLLESAVGDGGRLVPFENDTAIFILPGFRFEVCDLLLTNFHLPRSTLFMLVSAFAGMERAKAAYAHAIAQRYRFYSYGDACLFRPETTR
jgi:S-adenosylmethionine:tRNA ribosyltransferase-isomerase